MRGGRRLCTQEIIPNIYGWRHGWFWSCINYTYWHSAERLWPLSRTSPSIIHIAHLLDAGGYTPLGHASFWSCINYTYWHSAERLWQDYDINHYTYRRVANTSPLTTKLRITNCALPIMHYALCITHYALRIAHYPLCIMHYQLCIMNCASRPSRKQNPLSPLPLGILPLPPADQRPTQTRPALGTLPPFRHKRRIKKASRCAWHAQHSSIISRVQVSWCCKPPLGRPCIISGSLRYTNPDGYILHLAKQEGSFLLISWCHRGCICFSSRCDFQQTIDEPNYYGKSKKNAVISCLLGQ